MHPAAGFGIAAVLAFALAGCSAAAPSDRDVLERALAHLADARQADGRFPPALAPHIVEAAWAAGRDPASWPTDRPVLQDVPLPRNVTAATYLQALRPLFALALADAPGAEDRRATLLAGFDGRQFGDEARLNDDAFAILALVADGHAPASPEIQAAATALLEAHGEGLWPHTRGGAGSVDMTGMVLAALAAAGRGMDAPAESVLEGLRSARKGDGFAESARGEANCDSTAWAIRAHHLVGAEAPAAAWDYLRGLQRDDGGFAYLPGQDANALCTSEAATLWGLLLTDRLRSGDPASAGQAAAS